MNTTPRPPKPSEGRNDPVARRIRYTIMTAILLTAVTASCIVATTIASRFKSRIDVTTTRDHALSQRTKSVLSGLTDDYEITVSAAIASIDRRARQRIADVLDEFIAASPRLSIRWIDSGSMSGRDDFAAFLTDLSARHADTVERHSTALAAAAEASAALAAGLPELAESLRSLRDAIPASDPRRPELDQLASFSRTLAEEFTRLPENLGLAANTSFADVVIPAADAAQQQVAPLLTAAAETLDQLAAYLRSVVAQAPDEPQRDASVRAESLSVSMRDSAARAGDALARLRPLEPLTIARAMQSRDVVLVSSPTSTVAIDFMAIFPTSQAIDAAQTSHAEIRFAGEELITTALASLANPATSIVVFVHAERTRMFAESGGPTLVALRAFGGLLNRLQLRRASLTEWAVALDDQAPSLSRLNPSGDRPVVWCVLPSPSPFALDPSRGATAADRIQRIDKLGRAVTALIRSGADLIINTDPSDLPGSGAPDPVAEAVAALGARVDTARPLIRQERSHSGAITYPFQVLDQASADHPIGNAISALRTILPWVCPITLDASNDMMRTHPILTVPAGPTVWGESQWLALRLQFIRLQQPFQPAVFPDPPTPNESRDNTLGPWIVAAAIERDRSLVESPMRGTSHTRPQRAVIVGSPTWFDDAYTTATERIAGRNIWRFPGNMELLDAAVDWLSHRDDLIAPGPRARDIARIGPLTPAQVATIRWTLILGLPVAVLLIGGVIRLLNR